MLLSLKIIFSYFKQLPLKFTFTLLPLKSIPEPWLLSDVAGGLHFLLRNL